MAVNKTVIGSSGTDFDAYVTHHSRKKVRWNEDGTRVSLVGQLAAKNHNWNAWYINQGGNPFLTNGDEKISATRFRTSSKPINFRGEHLEAKLRDHTGRPAQGGDNTARWMIGLRQGVDTGELNFRPIRRPHFDFPDGVNVHPHQNIRSELTNLVINRLPGDRMRIVKKINVTSPAKPLPEGVDFSYLYAMDSSHYLVLQSVKDHRVLKAVNQRLHESAAPYLHVAMTPGMYDAMKKSRTTPILSYASLYATEIGELVKMSGNKDIVEDMNSLRPDPLALREAMCNLKDDLAPGAEVYVTAGKHGIFYLAPNFHFFHIPSARVNVAGTVGSGDASFAAMSESAHTEYDCTASKLLYVSAVGNMNARIAAPSVSHLGPRHIRQFLDTRSTSRIVYQHMHGFEPRLITFDKAPRHPHAKK